MKYRAPSVPSPHTLAPIPEPDFQYSRLDNGLLVASLHTPWLHEVGATVFVRAGSRYELPKECGIAHFLEHMLFKGTKRIPEPTRLHAALEELAADMNGATGQESGAYWLSLPVEYLHQGFPLFCEIFTDPVFTDVASEQRVVIAEMREEENDLGETTNAFVLAGVRLWPGHALGRPVLGTRDTLASFGKRQLRAYLKRRYRGPEMAAAFFGPIDHPTALALANEGLGSLPGGERTPSEPPPPMPPGPHWVAVDDQGGQLSLNLFFRGPGRMEPGFHAMLAMRRLLDDGFSSRLPANIRENRGLVYDVGASFNAFPDTGAFEVWTSVSPENLQEVFALLLTELAILRSQPPPAPEWQRLLTRWRADLITALDRPGELLERYVADRLSGVEEPLARSWKEASGLDPNLLPQYAKSLFSPENMVLVLVGPHATEHIHLLKAMGLEPLLATGGEP